MPNHARIPTGTPTTGHEVLGVIPARIGSSRLPRKPLIPIAGRPLIEWVWRRMAGLDCLGALVVAADDPEVIDVVEAFGGRAVSTRPDHRSGTDRVAEVAERPEYSAYPWILNLQGDEPFLPPHAAEAAVKLVREGWDVGTVALPIEDPTEWRDASTVKVVRNDRGGALYFSRAAIPHDRDEAGEGGDEANPLQHVGLYAFERSALRWATSLAPHALELREGLEQLRWLAGGLRIGVAVLEGRGGPGIDTQEDLVKAEELLRGGRERHE